MVDAGHTYYLFEDNLSHASVCHGSAGLTQSLMA